MSEACLHCGIQIHSGAWHPVNYRLMGVWPGMVKTTSVACMTCGYDTYYAQVNQLPRIGWTGSVTDLARLPTYRRPTIPNHMIDVWYVLHPLGLSSDFHGLVLKRLDEMRKDRVFLITEDRFGIDTSLFAGVCVVGGVKREGPYPSVMTEWAATTTVHNRLGKTGINTIWPSYFMPGFEYHSVMSDSELYRAFSYDFRRNLPIEIKVKP